MLHAMRVLFLVIALSSTLVLGQTNKVDRTDGSGPVVSGTPVTLIVSVFPSSCAVSGGPFNCTHTCSYVEADVFVFDANNPSNSRIPFGHVPPSMTDTHGSCIDPIPGHILTYTRGDILGEVGPHSFQSIAVRSNGTTAPGFSGAQVEWTNPPPAIFASLPPNTIAPGIDWSSFKTFPADLNGDGKTDFCLSSPLDGNWSLHCVLGNGDGTFGAVRWNTIAPGIDWSSFKTFAGDLNGDGRADFCLSSPLNGNWSLHCVLGNGDGTFGPVRWNTIAPGTNFSPFSTYAADLNGDGRTDFCLASLNGSNWSLHCVLGNGDGYFGPVRWNTIAPGTNWSPHTPYSADLNGDRRTDFCASSLNGGNWSLHCVLGNGDGYFGAVNWNVLGSGMDWSPYGAHALDLNGDGRADFCASWPNAGNWSLRCVLGNGNGTFGAIRPNVMQTGTDWSAFGTHKADLDGDGKADFCASSLSGGSWLLHCVFGNGDGTFGLVHWSTIGAGTNWSAFSSYPADLNADQRGDFCASSPNGSHWALNCVRRNP